MKAVCDSTAYPFTIVGETTLDRATASPSELYEDAIERVVRYLRGHSLNYCLDFAAELERPSRQNEDPDKQAAAHRVRTVLMRQSVEFCLDFADELECRLPLEQSLRLAT